MARKAAFYEQIGRIAVEFSYLDRILSAMLEGLVGPDQWIAGRLVADMSVPRKAALVSEIFKHRHPQHPFRTRLERALSQVEPLARQRNQVMHSLWLLPRDGDKAFRLNPARMKTPENMEHGLHPLGYFRAIRVGVSELAHELEAVADALYKEGRIFYYAKGLTG